MGKQIRLTQEQKIFIIQGLARYLTPTQVREAVKAEFEVEPSLSLVCWYDPSKGKKKIDPRLVEIFNETRQAFRKTTAEHAIADIGYRIGRLQRMSEQAERMKNLPLAASLLEQAAKDVGGAFTNKSHVVVTDERESHMNGAEAWLETMRRAQPDQEWTLADAVTALDGQPGFENMRDVLDVKTVQ